MSVLVMIPSRDSPDKASQARDSVLRTSRADVVICVDDDQIHDYHPLVGDRTAVVSAPRTDIVGTLNAAVAKMANYQAYGLLVDDARLTIPGWDDYLLETIDQFPGRIGVVSAAHSVGAFLNFGYVSRAWIDTLGWYACPDTAHYCWDTVMELLGEATSIVYAPKDRFFIQHDLHRSDGSIQVFYKDCVQFLGWCVNGRRDLVARLREHAGSHS